MLHLSALVRDWEVHLQSLSSAFSIYLRRKVGADVLRAPRAPVPASKRIPGRRHEPSAEEAEAMAVEAMEVLYDVERAVDGKLAELERCLRETERALREDAWGGGEWARAPGEAADADAADGGAPDEAMADGAGAICHLAAAAIVEACRNEHDTLKAILRSARHSGPARATLQTYLMVLEERAFGDQHSILRDAEERLARRVGAAPSREP